MQTVRALPHQHWSEFLTDLADERRTAAVQVDVAGTIVGDPMHSDRVLLDELAYDDVTDVFEIRTLGPAPNEPVLRRHAVVHPCSIEVDAPAGILPAAMRVLCRDGSRMLIELSLSPAVAS